MDRARFATFAAFIALIPFAAASPAQASPHQPPVAPPRQPPAAPSDVRELTRTDFALDGHALPKPHYRPRPESRSAAATTPPIGTVRNWLGLDDTTGKYYPKSYTLRAVGRHIEVWVAKDLAFPAGDCRKDAIDVSDAQVADLVKEFDGTIYPKETAAFSTPPDRDGSHPEMSGDFSGDGDKTVTLVDNIRDANYYTFPKAITYTAGFFSPQLNELFDRNVMTIDAYDWKHRMGANPPDDPTNDLCTSRPAHPRMYEATFAHEWQHLLEYYADPNEVTWVNEGLSDFAQTLTGYVDSRARVDQRGMDNHLTCFQGFGNVKTKFNPNPRDCGGPQNSLNLWNEGTPTQILADYGNAYEFMLYLRDRFGLGIITKLHRDGAHQGLAGVAAVLPAGVTLASVLHDYQLMVLVDRYVDRRGGTVSGIPKIRVIANSLRSTVNLDNPSAYDTPGAAPNGADYVPLPTPLHSISFRGANFLPALPTGWTIADDTLFSGNTSDLSNAAVLPISVPADSPTLSLETAWDAEAGFDFAYVEISTDGGKSYTAIPGDRTVPGLLGPGLSGASNGVETISYPLSPYAGKDVLLALHYVSDSVVNKGGWRIGKITLSGKNTPDKIVSDGSTLDGWKSPTAINPIPVTTWHVTLVGLSGSHAAVVPIDQFAQLSVYKTVVAVIGYDDPTELITQYAPYQLTVNGVLQPGGAPIPADPSPPIS